MTLTWIIFGLIAGAIAKAIHPGSDPRGWIATIIIGIIGAIVGGWLGSNDFWRRCLPALIFQSFLVAIGGAVLHA